MKTYKELEQENFVFVNNYWFNQQYQENYGIESVLILSIIQKNKLIRGSCLFSIDYLLDCLGFTKGNTRQVKSKIVCKMPR
jgi:hypothetical protein